MANRCCTIITVIVVLWVAPAAMAQNVEMGETYRSLDALTTRMTTEYVNAQVVTERTPDGSLESTLFSPGGVELGTLRADLATGHVEVDLSLLRAELTEVPARPFADITTDWANSQLYSLWMDFRQIEAATGLDTGLVFDGALARPREVLKHPDVAGAAGQRGSAHVRSLRQQERAVTTAFGDLVALSRRADPLEETAAAPGGTGTTFYTTYTTHLVNQETGRTVGFGRYFDEAKVFVWDAQPISSGYVSAETVPGGWTFDHNMAWANVQMFSFLYFHGDELSALDSSLVGSVDLAAPGTAGGSSAPGGASRSGSGGNSLALKNEPGCDALHWLDDTVYKECCDQHDRCFGYDPDTNEQTIDDPCSIWSWLFVEGWRCTKCNLNVIWCFLTATFDGPGGGDGGGGGSNCTTSGAEWCPAECFSCTRLY